MVNSVILWLLLIVTSTSSSMVMGSSSLYEHLSHPITAPTLLIHNSQKSHTLALLCPETCRVLNRRQFMEPARSLRRAVTAIAMPKAAEACRGRRAEGEESQGRGNEVQREEGELTLRKRIKSLSVL